MSTKPGAGHSVAAIDEYERPCVGIFTFFILVTHNDGCLFYIFGGPDKWRPLGGVSIKRAMFCCVRNVCD